MTVYLTPTTITRQIERRRRRWALLAVLVLAALLALALALGALSVQDVVQKLADKSIEIVTGAVLVALGVTR